MTGAKTLPGLNGVWMQEPDTIHVAGIEGTLAHVDFDTFAYELERLPTPTRLTFHALHGAAGRLIAVGGNLNNSVPPYRGLTAERGLEERQ